MRRRAFLALSAGTIGAVAGCTDEDGDDAHADGPPRLHVEGRWVFDPEGNPVVLRGVSLPDPVWGVEHADERGMDYWDTLRLAADASAGWHARVLRIPITPASIRSVGIETVLQEYVDRAVDLAAELGVYALVDYQAIGRYDAPSTDRRLRQFWNAVAPRYAGRSHVLYELFSDPSEPAGDGMEDWLRWRGHASPWVSLVRDHAPETPVVVGSPALSSMTAYAAEEPFEHDDLLYAAHVYPSWDPTTWEATFGTPTLDVPVFVTEWGYAGGEDAGADHLVGTTSDWGEPFRDWIDAHQNVHWCATAFDALRQPAIFEDDWTPTGGADGMGSLVKRWLAERRDDHRPGDPTPIPPDGGAPPPAPTTVRIASIGEDSATIQWDASPTTDGSGTLQYRVAVDDRDPAIVRGSERSVDVTGLEAGREYEARVVAVDASGVVSEPATVSFATHEPEDPLAQIARTSTGPTREGEEWDDVASHAIDQYIWGEQILGVGEWRALWDEDVLYVLVGLTEPDGVSQDTVLELYLDLDGSGGTNYDGDDDMQLLVPRGSDVAQTGTNSAPAAEGISVTTEDAEDGWWTQIEVPWSPYGVRPVAGHRFGLDVHFVLRDDGGRVGKRSWFDEFDDAWEDPSVFATVELDT